MLNVHVGSTRPVKDYHKITIRVATVGGQQDYH